jgi:hypothetical protein
MKTKESLTSLLVIVALLALTAIAAAMYGGNAEQKSQLEGNFFWQKAKWAIELAFSVVPDFINPKSYSGNDATGATDSASSVVSDSASVTTGFSGFWSDFLNSLKTEWTDNVTEGATASSGVTSQDLSGGASVVSTVKYLEWRQTDTGSEIIFRSPSGTEYKLSLPFHFAASQ